jgi:pimeloyl-ACP methyl ester carboxylesterase
MKKDWHGYEKSVFKVNKRSSLVVHPLTAAPGNPWVWRAEYFEAFDQVDRALLDQGWHIAYHSVSQLYGAPIAIDSMKDFHDYVCKEFGLAQKAIVFGFSVGGLYTFNYGYAHSDDVFALYLDAPALNLSIFQPWDCWPVTKAAYAKTYESLDLDDEAVRIEHKLSPNDRAAELAKMNIPVVLVVGLLDEAAVYEKNGAIFKERFEAAGGDLTLFTKPDCAHHPHSLEDPTPIVQWILQKWSNR